MRKPLALLIGLATLVLVSEAEASERSVWKGMYGGLNLGVGWIGGSSLGNVLTPPANSITSGLNLGGQLGINWSAGGFLVGLETDLSLPDIDNSADCSGAGLCWQSDEIGHQFQGSIRLRSGVSFGPVLLYGTAGYEFANLETSPLDYTTRYRGGWTIGGGLETRLSDNASLAVEYRRTLFDRLGSDIGGIDARQLHPNEVIFRLNLH